MGVRAPHGDLDGVALGGEAHEVGADRRGAGAAREGHPRAHAGRVEPARVGGAPAQVVELAQDLGVAPQQPDHEHREEGHDRAQRDDDGGHRWLTGATRAGSRRPVRR